MTYNNIIKKAPKRKRTAEESEAKKSFRERFARLVKKDAEARSVYSNVSANV